MKLQSVILSLTSDNTRVYFKRLSKRCTFSSFSRLKRNQIQYLIFHQENLDKFKTTIQGADIGQVQTIPILSIFNQHDENA